MKEVTLMLEDEVAEALERYREANESEEYLGRSIAHALHKKGFLEKHPLPFSVDVGTSGIPDLARCDEELLWVESKTLRLFTNNN